MDQLKPALEDLSDPIRESLQYCTENHYSKPEAEKLFDLLSFLESLTSNGNESWISNQFQTASKFSTYLANVRKHAVQREGWRSAVIHSTLKTNRTGVYRPVLDLMLEKIHDGGGADAVIQFRKVWQEGRRVFSAPWKSQHMGDYACDVGEKGRVVLADVYSDGTTLSNSGTQSANNMRVRFSNIRGITSQWFEVGIVPTLNLDDLKVSDAAARREKNELWQRFTFMAFKTCIEKSHVGVVVGGIKLFPKLGAIVTDQVQERPTCGLKGHDCFFDCTHCFSPSVHGKQVRQLVMQSLPVGNGPGLIPLHLSVPQRQPMTDMTP